MIALANSVPGMHVIRCRACTQNSVPGMQVCMLGNWKLGAGHASMHVGELGDRLPIYDLRGKRGDWLLNYDLHGKRGDRHLKLVVREK